MSKQKNIPDADLSSAGDDYHILWAIKKSLELLNFDSKGLKVVSIEGLERSLSKKIDPYGEKLLGIDLVEFYGGENFKDAKEVIISQLKYSTRRANENWTFSSLYRGKKSGSYRGSIIHRLASIYKTFTLEFGRDLIIEKVKIKLVSNRDFNKFQLQEISNIQKILLPINKKKSFNQILKNLKKYNKAFQNLLEASELKVTEFSDFISLLNFEDCGTSSRDYLEKELIVAISNTSITSRDQYNNLSRLIWKKMMPESKNYVRLTLYDIIASLGFTNGSLENLFPVPQHFEKLETKIEREQINSIVLEIEKSKGLPICIHGVAGIGKSTISQQIKDFIPKYCECISFDCYGNGSYLDPSDRRHLHRNALLHISNEIAKRTGVDFLINKNESDEVYLKEFKRRIKDGINILKKRNKKAYLIIIIDAADNNVTAAVKRNESSFVHDLLEETFPDDCKLIFTTRSYRKNSLKLPHKYIDIEILPFSRNETREHLTSFFSNSSIENINEFHILTDGIPRVQSYAINLKKEGISEVINYLKPNGKVVEDLIEERINEAVKKIGNNGRKLVNSFFTNLITLPRPVPLDFISKILKVEEGFLIDLSSDIWHGLILENDNFSFRDEDFENYIREEYIPRDINFKKIAKLFIKKANENEYASINLADVLFQAGFKENLKSIVLENKYRLYPKDPIRNKEVYINRTKLAMKVADNETDNLTYFKLLFIAAEESKTDKALTNLLVNNPDLVIRFGNEDSLNRLTTNSEEKTWGGSFHLKLAGIYSRNKYNKEIVKKHLKTALNWLEWRRNSLEKDELRNYPISSLDIAFETEAVLRITNDSHKTYQSLKRWSPKTVWLSAGNYFLNNVLLFSNEENIKKWLKEIKVPFLSQVIIVNKLFSFNLDINEFNLNEITNYLLKVLKKKVKFKKEFYRSIIDFCEILIYTSDISKDIIFDIFSRINYTTPTSVPHFTNKYNRNRGSELQVDLSLRIETLKSSLNNNEKSLDSLYPDKFKDFDKIENYEKRKGLESDKSDFDRFFRHALSIFQLKSDKITGRLTDVECISKFKLVCESIEKDWEFRHYTHWSADRLNYLASYIIDFILLFGLRKEFIELVLASFKNDKANRISLRLKILNQISHLNVSHLICLKLLNDIEEFVIESVLSSNESTEIYLECSIIGSKIDRETGKHFFDKAIEAVSDIDYEAFAKIRCIYALSERGIAKPNPKLAYEYARYIEYADLKLSYYDKKHFPYKEGLKGIFNLDSGSAFSIVCRWHHRDIVDLKKYITPILKVAHKNKVLNHKVTSSLLSLSEYYYFDELTEMFDQIIKAYHLKKDTSGKSYFTRTIFRDLRLEQRNSLIKELYSKIKDDKYLDNSILEEIKEFIEFDNFEKTNRTKRFKNDIAEEKEEEVLNVKFKKTLSTEEIEANIKQIIIDNKDFHNRWPIDKYLTEVKNSCEPKEYVNQLNALVNISTDLLNFYSFENALSERLQEWKIHPGVKRWMKENFKFVLLTWFNKFNDDDYFRIWDIKKFAELFCISNNEMINVLMDVLPNKIEVLSDESIYGIFNLINSRLTKEENNNLLEWVFKSWNSKIDDEFADGLWCESMILPKSSDIIVAKILRFILGHPDKRIRWRAIHSIRRLINLNEHNILKELLCAQNDKNCHPFQYKKYHFHWISAKLYLWIAIERSSKENPKHLIPFKDDFFKELFNKDLPHVLIQFFIKNTCLNLYNYDKSIFSKEQLVIINGFLVSTLPKKENDYSYSKNTISKNKKRRFKFDYLDTLPYLYNGLSSCFQLHEEDVADIADKYISEIWGFKGNPNKDDLVKDLMQNERGYYELTSNRKGNTPVIENLKNYYEYHAMFCAANDLLKKHPLVVSEYEGEYGTWEYWLNSKTNVWSNFWLSDFRDPIPLDKKYWVNEFNTFDESWRDNVEDEKFDSEVGFDNFLDKKFIVAYKSINRYFGDNEERVSIRSALVSNKGSHALLRALQTTKDSHDYLIPFENEQDKFEIKHLGFEYYGWLINHRSDNSGLDSDDPFSVDNGKDYVILGDKVTSLFDITFGNFNKNCYCDDKLISEYIHWYETKEYKHVSDVQSDGTELKVDIKFILKFLNKINKCLIIECEIERQLKKRIYRNRKRELDIENNLKIYLIKPNGTVKTIRGRDYKIR